MKDLILEKEGHLATIILNRPNVMNSMGMTMSREFHEVLDILEREKDIYSVIITGAGDKAFSAGADLKERKEMTESQKWEHTQNIGTAFKRIENLSMPVIAAIKGYCLGGGTELAVCCDIRIAAEDAKIGLTEVKLGIFPGTGGPVRLPRLIHVGKAKELLFTGRHISGAEAERIGLVEKAVLKTKVLEEAKALAEMIAENGPLGVQAVKKVVNYGTEASKDVALAYADAQRKPLDKTYDYKEALMAFAEKRKPQFKGE